MSCLLFKLAFEAPVHFGSQDSALSLFASEEYFRADTLFSALCHTALHSEGESGIERLCRAVNAGEIVFSDAMPYRDDELFLPKPFVSSESAQELPAQLRKAVKKLQWIPVSSFGSFSESVHGGKPFVPEEKLGFGVHEEQTRAAVTEGEAARPYQVGAFRFYDNCGLWFICVCADEYSTWIEKLVASLGYSGIGGKISSGYGSFRVDDLIMLDEPFDEQTQWLSEAVMGDGDSYLLLTSSLPNEAELDKVIDGASFRLVRRSGFIQSESYAETQMKKETQYYLAAGSVVKCRFKGGLYDVGTSGSHPVYRYSVPVLLGVSL